MGVGGVSQRWQLAEGLQARNVQLVLSPESDLPGVEVTFPPHCPTKM